jgi:hypothetical protein
MQATKNVVPMSQRQKDYLTDLIRQRSDHPEVAKVREDLNACLRDHVLITREFASNMIDVIKKFPLNPPPPTAAIAKIADHEESEQILAAFSNEKPKWAGKFALGEEPDLKFYKVDRPTKGKWAGWTFVKRLIGAPGEWREDRLPKGVQADILELIAADPAGAQAKYGHHFQECGRCASPLSHPCSRAAGYGAICAGHEGWFYPTLEQAREILTARYGAAKAAAIESEWEATK